MDKKILKGNNKTRPIMFLAIGVEIVIILLLLLVTITELNDPIDLDYFPSISYFIFHFRIVILIIQSFLFYFYRKSGKRIVAILILGGVVGLTLFGINEIIALSVAFN